MRILLASSIFPPDIGGPATYSFKLASELARRGFGVRVVSYGYNKKLLPKGIRHLVYFFHIFFASLSCEVVYAQNAVSAGFGAMLSAKILRRRFVVKIVGDAAWERAREKNVTTDELEIFQNKEYGWRIELLRKVQKFTSNKSDAIIVPSAYLKKIVAGWGIDESKINVVYNSAEVEVSADFWKITKKQAQNQIGLRGGIILSIGRLVPWKGFGGLISIMPGLLSKNPSLMLVIVGDGPSLEDLRFKIEDLRLNENVKLVGVIEHDKLPLYFKATDVFVLNSSYEGLSHVLLEAMAYKTPIIATNVGGNPELIEDGVNGFLVKRGDLEDLKSKILRLHGDEFLRNKFIENSSEKVRRFSFERMINDTIQILGYTNTTL